jgi:hypothetical protein
MMVRVNMVDGIGARSLRMAREGGQALVFTTLFAGAAALVALMLYDSGMLANTKTQLQNAADAAAYSGGLMLARDHNFSAYANRAMVANQVAVAQFVSLKSYLEDAHNTHDRLSSTLQAFQAATFPTDKKRWDLGKKSLIGSADTAFSKIAGPAVQSIDKLIQAFGTAQELHHKATAANVMFVLDEVVKKNDPKARVSTGAFQTGNTAVQLKKWEFDYTKRYGANDASKEADRFADLVVSDQSTDPFTRNRTSVPTPGWNTSVKICLGAVKTSTVFMFMHGGGTILSQDKRRWLALDATMGEGLATCKWVLPFPPWKFTLTIPLFDPGLSGGPLFGGSGGASVGQGSGYNEVKGYKNNPWTTRGYGAALFNPLTMWPALSRYWSGPGTNLDNSKSGGLQDYYRDMGDLANKPKNQSPELNGGDYPLTVEVEHKQADMRSSSQVFGSAAQNIKLNASMKENAMRALSSAHAYFYRANKDSSAFTRSGWAREDGRTELANLFNPYWQARLVAPSDAERWLSKGFQ